jgi:subtilisin family serine protease
LVNRSVRTFLAAAVAAATLAPTAPLSVNAIASPAESPSNLPDKIAELFAGDLTGYQWHLDAVRAREAWSVTKGAGVRVAIIDSGIDATHPDLADALEAGAWVKRVTRGGMSVTAVAAGDHTDPVGHGTHVAGLVAGDDDGAGIVGVAPDARLIPIGLDFSNIYTNQQFDRMLTKAVEVAVAADADVINMSLGANAAAVGCTAVELANANDIVVVVAAGNYGAYSNPAEFPASCPGVVTVSATRDDGQTTFWSSFDAPVDIAAPGEDVVSSLPESDAAYTALGGVAPMSGTSMASPIVAGVAALVRAANPSLSAAQVAMVLQNAAADAGNPGWDPEYGYGVVDAYAAVTAGAGQLTAAPKLAAAIAYNPSAASFADATVVTWRPVRGVSTIGYTVKIFGGDTVVETAVAGDQVRAPVGAISSGEWVQVVAHTSAGDVASFPVALYNSLETPEASNFKSVRSKAGSITVSFDQPKGATDWYVFLEGYGSPTRLGYQRGTASQGPVDVVFESKRKFDAYVILPMVIVEGAWFVSVRFAPEIWPRQLVRVDEVGAAGRHNVVVVGSVVDDYNMVKVKDRCAFPCAGRRVSLYGANGAKVASTIVNYRGEFSAVLPRAKDAKRVKLTVGLDRHPGMNAGALYGYKVVGQRS